MISVLGFKNYIFRNKKKAFFLERSKIDKYKILNRMSFKLNIRLTGIEPALFCPKQSSINLKWRQLTNVNMKSIVILSSSLTSSLTWRVSNDEFWCFITSLTFFDEIRLFWHFSKFKSFEKFFQRKLTHALILNCVYWC